MTPSQRLDPRLLPTFLAVLEHGRVSAAAKALHLSQPAVTAQIRKLEDELGAPLFLRSAAGVSPTAAGTTLAGYARTMQRLLGEAALAVVGAEEPTGELALAASTTIAAYVLPSVLARFRASHPAIGLRIVVGNTEEVIADVKRGGVAVGLVEGHARASGIHLEPYVDDEIVAVSGLSAGGAAFRVRRAGDLARVPILWQAFVAGRSRSTSKSAAPPRSSAARARASASPSRRAGRSRRTSQPGSSRSSLGSISSSVGPSGGRRPPAPFPAPRARSMTSRNATRR
jgi:DNA-binding transcriptional LysR family regulator